MFLPANLVIKHLAQVVFSPERPFIVGRWVLLFCYCWLLLDFYELHEMTIQPDGFFPKHQFSFLLKTKLNSRIKKDSAKRSLFNKKGCRSFVWNCRFSQDSSTQTIPKTIKAPLLGIYYGNQGWAMDDVRALEDWQGKKNAVVELFTNWNSSTTVINNLFNQQLLNIWNNQNVPLITWEPYITGITPADIEARIANGDYDSYINTWAERLKTFLSGPDDIYDTSDDRRVYLRLAHEMNGDWYPWSAAMGGNSSADYVRMWRRTKDIFDQKGLDATHVQWMWSVNHRDIGGYRAESYYPGDAYVDWVTIDGYNWGTSQLWSSWQTAAQVFQPMIDRLKALTGKPIAITEVASSTMTDSGVNVMAKSQWVTDFYQYAINQNIKLVTWFNSDKETDWAAFGGGKGDGTLKSRRRNYQVYNAYQSVIESADYRSSDSSNPRLLTDYQFWGLK